VGGIGLGDPRWESASEATVQSVYLARPPDPL
jgi:hypothetical protein